MAATLKGSNGAVIYDGKKTLTLTGNSVAMDLSTIKGHETDWLTSKATTKAVTLESGRTSNVKVTLDVDASDKEINETKITVIDATKASNVSIVGGSKASAISLGGGTNIVRSGSTGSDKFYGNSGSDTFYLGKGDQVGDGKNTLNAADENDVIVLSDATVNSISELSFTDNAKGQTVIQYGKSNKYTVNKKSINTRLTIKDSKGNSYTYGADGSTASLDSALKTLTINEAGESEVVNASTIAAGVKNIYASAVYGDIYLIGNGQANNITLDSYSGGTIYGGYAHDVKTGTNKVTNDNLYAPSDREGGVTFYIDSLSGNDVIYNYRAGDTIYIADGSTTSLDMTAQSKVFKDGGVGKDVAITYQNGQGASKKTGKITIKQYNGDVITLNLNGKEVTYGVDLGEGASVDAKKTTLVLGAEANGATYGLQGWTNESYTGDASDDALRTYAPKISIIDATNVQGNVTLVAPTETLAGGSLKTTATTFKGSTLGADVWMVGGKDADQFNGGNGQDVFLIKASQGKDVIDNYGEGDIVVLDLSGVPSSIGRYDDVQIDSKGVIYYQSNLKGDDAKKNNITVKNFKKTTATAPVVVVSPDGKILAVSSNEGVPAPNGVTVAAKTGITTSVDYDGLYDKGVYVKGEKIDLENLKLEDTTGSYVSYTDNNGGRAATLDANDYGGAVKSINASIVSHGLESLVINGNAAVKNTIYLPVREDTYPSKTRDGRDTVVSEDSLEITVRGGTAADTFIGNTTSTKTSVTYVYDGGGKDIIQNFNPSASVDGDEEVTSGDEIVIEGMGTLGFNSSLVSGEYLQQDLTGKAVRAVSEKGTDVIFTFDSKNSLTIKNGAGKLITFVDSDNNNNNTYKYGHVLDDGLVYDTKHTAINADTTVMNELVGLGTEKSGNVTNSGSRSYDIDLSDTDASGSNFYTTIKTVSLSGANQFITASVSGNSLANELYAAQGGSTLYGGAGYAGAKNKWIASADKLYGNIGADTFIYGVGDGADVIGVKKAANSSLMADDEIILKSNDTLAISRDDVVFTDKKEVLTISFTGTDAVSKASKLTVNKDKAATPVKLWFTDKNGTIGSDNNDYFVFGVDDRYFQANASDIDKGSLVVTGGGTLESASSVTVINAANGSSERLKLAQVNVKNVSSGLKNVGVSADSDTVVSLVGGTAAINVTMGAGGGTVEGGYTIDAKGKNKSYNDKFYASADAKRGTTFVIRGDLKNGTDNIYNYDAARGDVIYFADAKPDTVAFSKNSIKFMLEGNKDGVVVNAPTGTNFTSETNITISWLQPSKDGKTSTRETKTLYGWNTTTDGKKFDSYTNNERNPDWTRSGDTFIYAHKAESDSDNLAGVRYTLSGSSIIDADNNFEPDEVDVSAESEGNVTISFGNNGNASTYAYIDPVMSGFHIWGDTLAGGSSLNVNGTTYELKDVDGNTLNGFELTKGGWAKLDDSSFVHFDTNNKAEATLTGALTDPKLVGSDNDILGKFTWSGDNPNASTEITIALTDTDASMANAHLKLQTDAPTNSDRFATANKYTVKTTNTDATPASIAVYKLYDGDNNTVNGYELLRTDLADVRHWTLSTEQGQNGLQQVNGTGLWHYSDTTANKSLIFDVSSAAKLMPTADGLPDGITVGSGENGTLNTTTIYVDSSKFDPANIIFDKDTKTGSEAGVVRISGVDAGTEFKIGTGSAATIYVTAELDNDTDNGFEFLKKDTSGLWTYDNGAWTYDNAPLRADKERNLSALKFTITKDASIEANDNGLPKDITVNIDNSKGTSTISFAGTQFSKFINASDTSVIVFDETAVTTGDVDKTVRIKGFASDTSVSIGAGQFYLADLDCDTSAFELLPVNTNWKRTADGWAYYAGGVPTVPSTVAPDLTIDTLKAGNVFISADRNGAPKGISFEGNQITFNTTLGAITAADSKSAGGDGYRVGVTIPADVLTLSSTTAVNASGVHILGQGTQSTTFMSDTVIAVKSTTVANGKVYYKLANLDRDTANGYELLYKGAESDTKNAWSFNNGMDDNGVATLTAANKALGSWTFESDAKVGKASKSEFTFSISEAASLAAADLGNGVTSISSIKAGNPLGVYVQFATGNGSDVTITADSSTLKLDQILFSSEDTDTFLSDTGVHFVGFNENDTLSVVVRSGADTSTAVYRLKDLDSDTGALELLKVTEGDVWSLNTASTLGARVWTYKDVNDKVSFTVAGDLKASEEGRPVNLNVLQPADGGTATIAFNQDTDTVAPTVTSDNFTLGGSVAVGVNGIHIVGFDTDTTIKTSWDSVYRLANLDSNASDLELVKTNINWTLMSKQSGDTAAGTWLYKNENFNLSVGSEAALGGTVVGANAEGAPIGIDVSVPEGADTDTLVITFDSSTLTTSLASGLGDHITLGANTKFGADGIHIKGLDSGTTTIKIGETDTYLVELDGEAENGYELLMKNALWTRTATGWTYSDATKGLAFTVGETLAADALGAPIGITVSAESDTILIETDTFGAPSLLTFSDATKAGSDAGIHIGLSGTAGDWALGSKDIEFEFKSTTAATAASKYLLKELDANTSTGYELLIANDKGWSLTTDESGKRTWHYDNDVVAFDIAPKDSDNGLKASAEGLPIGVAVGTLGAANNLQYKIEFTDTDGTNASSNDGTKSVEKSQLTFTKIPTGVSGIHITGLNASDTLVYSDSDTNMFDYDGSKYYLANISTISTASNMYELLKKDDNWHRVEGGWKYTSSDLAFTVAASIDSESAQFTLGASTQDEGKPFGVTVTSSEGSNVVTVDSSQKIAHAIVFDSHVTKVEKLHLLYGSGTGNNKNSSITSYKFSDTTATNADAAISEYYIVNTDGDAANGQEFYKKDTANNGTWERLENAWKYTASDNFQFLLDASSLKGSDAGQDKPSDITADSDSCTITFMDYSGFTTEHIALIEGSFSSGVDSDSTKATHFKGNGVTEGTSIKVVSKNSTSTSVTASATYQLYNADGDSDNGLELTNNGWRTYSAKVKAIDSNDRTFYAYVKGKDSSLAANTGFAIVSDDNDVIRTESDKVQVKGLVEGSTTSSHIAFTSDGINANRLTSLNFHVATLTAGTSGKQIGSIADGSYFYVGDMQYALKDYDTVAEGFEIISSDKKWAKVNDSSFAYVGDGSETALFTLVASGQGIDSNNDFVPDVISFNRNNASDINYNDSQFTIKLDKKPGDDLLFDLPTAQTTAADAFTFEWDGTSYYLTEATRNGNTSDDVKSYKLDTVKPDASAQLPAAGYSTTNYEVDDLINYENADATTDELDDILEVKPLAASASSAFDPSDVLTEVANIDKSINDVSYAARHKARK